MADIPKILVGNKSDGPSAIPINEAQKFADTFNMPVSTALWIHSKGTDVVFPNVVVWNVSQTGLRMWQCRFNFPYSGS